MLVDSLKGYLNFVFLGSFFPFLVFFHQFLDNIVLQQYFWLHKIGFTIKYFSHYVTSSSAENPTNLFENEKIIIHLMLWPKMGKGV